MDDLPLQKAESLREAIRVLDPERALRTSSELNTFFVQRPTSPIDEIQILLEDAGRPQKFLFTGHRGSGKSTELARLTQLLGSDYFVVRYSVKQMLNLFELSYVDVLLSIALELARVATEEDVDVPDAVLDHVLHFTRDVTQEIEIGTGDAGEVGAELNFVVGKLSAKLRTEDVTRHVVRRTVQTRLSDLLESIELMGAEIERHTGTPLLVVVEDLDKTDLGTARTLFYDYAATLSEPSLSIIYTFPTPLRHANAFSQVTRTFTNVMILPNVKTQRRDGTPYHPGIRLTKQILTLRLDAGLIDADALDELSRLSSGIPRELIILGRRACLEARTAGHDAITLDAVTRAANHQRVDYDVILDRDQRALLHDVYTSKTINNDEPHRELLHNLSVLEYRNADLWYDVHPLVVDLLD